MKKSSIESSFIFLKLSKEKPEVAIYILKRYISKDFNILNSLLLFRREELDEKIVIEIKNILLQNFKEKIESDPFLKKLISCIKS